MIAFHRADLLGQVLLGRREAKPAWYRFTEWTGGDAEIVPRVGELIDRYSGCLDTAGTLREHVDGLRDEWR